MLLLSNHYVSSKAQDNTKLISMWLVLLPFSYLRCKSQYKKTCFSIWFYFLFLNEKSSQNHNYLMKVKLFDC